MTDTIWQIITGALLGISIYGVVMTRASAPAWLVAFIASLFLALKVWSVL